MAQPTPPSDVILVGSIPLASTEEVLTKISAALPGRLHTIPDGETGIRQIWIRWQLACFPRETIISRLGGVDLSDSTLPEYTLESIQPTRYDEVAITSYAEFRALSAQGTIPRELRFQVCLPTPLNTVQCFVKPEFQEQLEPLYEARFRQALVRIVNEIPTSELAIQWDLCFDVMALEYDRGGTTNPRYKPYFSPIKKGILDRVSRLCALIPREVKLGFHLCYGDYEHKHFIEPVDTGLLVELANGIIATLGDNHPIEWIHMPVPKTRTDAAYFEPLTELKLPRGLLYLGLIHSNDEVGTRKRIGTASSVYRHPFGVATECGMGRTPKEELDSILQISKAVTVPKSASTS
ncbi:hypothetical protein MMC28_011038 [Mycoblastus sanguinarius]|nr:hypothetical protein [Mycoblastus sanguinarius]